VPWRFSDASSNHASPATLCLASEKPAQNQTSPTVAATYHQRASSILNFALYAPSTQALCPTGVLFGVLSSDGTDGVIYKITL
jgi:hypothetical protein